ncbi:MFS transporter [Gimesia fumaroli]|uniref:Proline/betaine transporter n=1 Tax=Gimesia fumaroli TaxID=2527976 RepID=A0A518IIR5_9PLAN|nr:MFS transporter [Gimesia fumaroli]QDV52986.1 Proline/betaine transporter [Gimesia fumaroli]
MSVVAEELENTPAASKNVRVLAAGFIGNILEWYDFAVYGFFAPTLGKLFFPSDNPTTSLIAAFGAFAAGFLMRPVGAVLFGHIGDRLGRKKALTLSVMMMAVPTLLVGVLPTHAQIGVTAAVLMVLLRMIQGVSVGGEYTSSFVFLVEHAPPHRRAFFGSWSMIGATCGILLGSAVGALINTFTTDEQLLEWGWRIPFLSGVLVAFVGYFIRHGIPEQPLSEELSEQEAYSPLKEAFASHKKEMLQSSGINMMNAVTFYTVFIYLSSWLVEEVGEDRAEALDINTISMAALTLFVPIAAILADKFGRKPFLLIGSAGIALFSPTLLGLMHHHNFALILTGQIGFALLVACFAGAIPATITELFKRGVRVSAASVSYNLPFAIFGGTAPMVAAWLVKVTGNPLSIAWYLSAIAGITFFIILTVKETNGKSLDE